MQTERQHVRVVVAGPLQRLSDDLAHIVGHRRDGRRVPDGAQQRRLDEGRQPEEIRIGVADLDERRSGRHHGTFRQGLDGKRQAAAVAADQRLPSVAVERQAMGGDQFVRLVDVVHRNAAGEILLQEHLQAEKQHVVMPPARPAFDIGGDRRRFGRILGEMGILVAVGIQDHVHNPALARRWSQLMLTVSITGPTIPYPRRTPPVFLPTLSTIRPASASRSASVSVRSVGCMSTSTATDFLPAPRDGPSNRSNTRTSAISFLSAPVTELMICVAATSASTTKAKSRLSAWNGEISSGVLVRVALRFGSGTASTRISKPQTGPSTSMRSSALGWNSPNVPRTTFGPSLMTPLRPG